MFFRWLHKSWKYFWGILFSLLFAVLVLGGLALGLLQLDATQSYLSDQIKQQFERSYNAELKIGEIDGFLPFQFNMSNVVLTRSDSTSADTLIAVEQVNSTIDVWGLMQNRVSITGFTVENPRINLKTNRQGKLTFLEPKEGTDKRTDATDQQGGWFGNVGIIAPSVQITNGTATVDLSGSGKNVANLPPKFRLSNISASMFIDWSSQQRYLDIESFTADAENLNMDRLELSGQFYNDDRYLEFNSFYITIDNSQMVLNGEIDGVDITKPNLFDQILAAEYNMNVNSEQVYPQELRDFSSRIPQVDQPFIVEFQAEGTADSLSINRAIVGTGESLLNVNGALKNLHTSDQLTYDFRIDRLDIRKEDAERLFQTLQNPQYRSLANLTVSGQAGGNLDSVDVNLALSGPLGELNVQANSRLKKPYEYQGTMQAKNLNVAPAIPATFDTTSVNGEIQFQGVGITLEDAVSQLSGSFVDSHINNIRFAQLTFSSSLIDGLWSQEYEYRSGNEQINGSGWVDFLSDDQTVSMKGNAENIDLAKFAGDFGFASSELDFDYNLEIQGLNPNRVQGRANIDVTPSIINGDTVRAHQLYMDLNSPDAPTRTFRLTSSLFDMNISGEIKPKAILDQGRFWSKYLGSKFKSEILMNTPIDSSAMSLRPPKSNVVLDGNISAKDLALIKNYIPEFPCVKTDTEISFNVNTDGTRLLLSAEMQADTLFYEQLNFNNSSTQLTASFRSDRNLTEFSSIDFVGDIGSLVTPSLDMDSVQVSLSAKKDSVYFTQNIGRIGNNAEFRLDVESSIRDTAISVGVRDFFLGNDEYAWINEDRPSFTYQRNGAVDFNQFSFKNQNEYFRLQGTLSQNRSDSLTYTLRDISLDRISDLITGKVEFAGILNGRLETRSLTRQPTIQGRLDVNRFTLNDRMIGDVRFNSRYNPDRNRFDTQIDIVTDSTKYENYLEDNDDIGQNIRLDGYFVTPNPSVEQDSVFYFDADFKEIDMWIIPLIVDNVFAEMEGKATGDGYITGNLDDFDFHADFQTKNVFAKPQFINTNYFLNGHVIFDRQDGVVLDSVQVMDTKGGTGTVWGNIDLNDFDPLTYLDLTLDMNSLQFLNNNMDPDVPFYGQVSGTGQVRLTGSNRDLYMRTVNPVQVTDDSDISIPLLEETELEQSGRFIRFVDSFENIDAKTTSPTATATGEDARQEVAEEQLQEAIANMTFAERFDLDLQFDASENVTVNLIFDPVTGEVLTAEGTGQLRITMQDQDVQMFGSYNINSGDYQFVTGEIISRQLELEPGGTIIWEGPPDNARLDISAIYNARPDISMLTADASTDPQDQNGGQQVPIDLIVEINGTLNSVENNYYFRLPSSIDLASNSTLQYTINQINRDEQQKLLQATSILFTGQFIPTEGTGSPTASLSQSLTRGSTVLNPLLSNQVISPLLSNQINALLNSDVSRLDIDFNLNAYNEVDLGIALRLYNDRLVLRREGQITGGATQSSLGERIGDLNATYRIQPGLSLTAFHRQDRVLNNLQTGSQAGDVTPTVDGIGLEAQIQYNTWKELLGRVNNTFKSLFGGKKKDKSEQQPDNVVAKEAIEEQKQNEQK